ncbi:MAG: asparaginase [Clostridiales bacterium]|nr:asparaginase [Clostridiales bacterium]
MLRKRVCVIATGGTIAGSGILGKSSVYRAGQIGVKELMLTIPDISSIAEVSAVQMLSVDSNEITPENWLELARIINMKDSEADGFVITHGTDTLEETAFFLNLTVHTEKPVVLTGAMRPATAVSPDGPLNLYQAISLAASEEAASKGVLVAFSEGIYSGRDVAKINTVKVDSFSENDFACLGYMRDNACYFFKAALKKHTVNSIFDASGLTALPKVEVAYFSIGADASILDGLAENSEGIVVAGAGSGNFSESWVEKVAKLSARGVPVVRSSRSASGFVTPNPFMDRAENSIAGNTLPPQKAKILLSLALTKTSDYKCIKKWFNEY